MSLFYRFYAALVPKLVSTLLGIRLASLAICPLSVLNCVLGKSVLLSDENEGKRGLLSVGKVEGGVCPAVVPQRKCVLCWLRFALRAVPPS